MYGAGQEVLPHSHCVLCSFTALKSAEPDKTVHSQISHEVTQLLDIKSQRGGGSCAGARGSWGARKF